MARIVKEEEYAAKRNEILDVAARLVLTKGYEQMSIQDILDDLEISKGAFYHYFASKPALLEALIEYMQPEVEQPLRAIVDDPHSPALEKLQRFFAELDRLRFAQKALIADLLHVWFADENAIVREKVDEVIVQRRAPLLAAIARQGVKEGVFTTPYPDQAGEIILSITRGIGNTVLRLILAFEQGRDELHYIRDTVAASAASAEAIERVLGAPSNSLYRPDAEAVKAWLAAL
jgi:AcrR family transcriptional regulator